MAKYGSANNNSTLKNDSADNSNNRKSTLSNSYLAPNSKLKVNQKDLLVFFRQLSVMLQSGVPLAQGLELLSENMIKQKNLLPVYLIYQED